MNEKSIEVYVATPPLLRFRSSSRGIFNPTFPPLTPYRTLHT